MYAVVRTTVGKGFHGSGRNATEASVKVGVYVPMVNRGYEECERFAEEKNRMWDDSGEAVFDVVSSVPGELAHDDAAAVDFLVRRASARVGAGLLGLVPGLEAVANA